MSKKKKAKPAAAKKPAKAAAKKAAKPPALPKTISLGRPTVGIDEDLGLFFKDDHPVRSIFEFLRARTVRDLETWSPDEIVKLLSTPIRQSVDRIRLRLAQHHRCLKGDEEYALKHRAE